MSLEKELILESLKQRMAGLQNGLLKMHEDKARLEKDMGNNRVALNELALVIQSLAEPPKEPDGSPPNL